MERAAKALLSSDLQTYLYRDVKRLFPGLDEVRFRRFVEMLGGLSGRTLNYAEAARALAYPNRPRGTISRSRTVPSSGGKFRPIRETS